MITKKMSLRSEDLVNQTALALPEREMMDLFNIGNVDVDVDQTNSVSGDDNQANQSNLFEMDCWQLAFALAIYSDYTEVEAEEAYQDCKIEKEIEQDNEDEDKKKRDDGSSEVPR